MKNAHIFTILFFLALVVSAFSLMLTYDNLDQIDRLRNKAFHDEQDLIDYFNNRGLVYQQEIAFWKDKAINGTAITYEVIHKCDSKVQIVDCDAYQRIKNSPFWNDSENKTIMEIG